MKMLRFQMLKYKDSGPIFNICCYLLYVDMGGMVKSRTVMWQFLVGFFVFERVRPYLAS
jgi:hypothetical protein